MKSMFILSLIAFLFLNCSNNKINNKLMSDNPKDSLKTENHKFKVEKPEDEWK